MAEERVLVIDAADRILGEVTRAEMRRRNLLHRSIAVLCLNGHGQIYLHQRSEEKDVFLGMYDAFVGGVVAADEDPDSAAKREVAEELGIVGPLPQFLFRTLYEGPASRSLTSVYRVGWDGPIVHRDGEIVWGRFMTVQELSQALAEGLNMVPDGAACLTEYRRLGLAPFGAD